MGWFSKYDKSELFYLLWLEWIESVGHDELREAAESTIEGDDNAEALIDWIRETSPESFTGQDLEEWKTWLSKFEDDYHQSLDED